MEDILSGHFKLVELVPRLVQAQNRLGGETGLMGAAIGGLSGTDSGKSLIMLGSSL